MPRGTKSHKSAAPSLLAHKLTVMLPDPLAKAVRVLAAQQTAPHHRVTVNDLVVAAVQQFVDR